MVARHGVLAFARQQCCGTPVLSAGHACLGQAMLLILHMLCLCASLFDSFLVHHGGGIAGGQHKSFFITIDFAITP